MTFPIRILSFLGLIALGSFGLAAPAHAYVDPNSGGILFQLLTPLLAVISALFAFTRRHLAMTWLMFVAAMRGFFARVLRASDRDAE